MKIQINGSLCDTEEEPGRCIEKLFEVIESLERQVSHNRSYDDGWIEVKFDELESRVEDLEK